MQTLTGLTQGRMKWCDSFQRTMIGLAGQHLLSEPSALIQKAVNTMADQLAVPGSSCLKPGLPHAVTVKIN